ncbi:MAG: flippase [Desulfobacterales bacterium]|nr:flippase [Desulfobacterales bacterium]
MTSEKKNTDTARNNIAHRFGSNFFYLAVSEVAAKGLFFATNIYIARVLKVENFGLFTLAQTITFYLLLGVGLGTNMYGIREVARNKEMAEDIINPLVSMRLVMAVLIFILYTGLLFLFEMEPTHRLIFIGCGLYPVGYALYSDWILSGLEKFKYIFAGSLVYSVTYFALTVWLVQDDNGLVTVSFIWPLSYFLGSFSLFRILNKKLKIKVTFHIDLKLWIFHLKESVYFMLSDILRSGYNYLPILLLKVFHTNYDVGLFAAPYRVVITLCHAAALIMVSVYPILSELHKKDKGEFFNIQKKLLCLMFIAAISGGLMGVIFGDDLIKLLLTEKYKQSGTVFKVMMWFFSVSLLRNAIGPGLQAAGLQKLHSVSLLMGLTLSVLIGSLLIYHYSYMGATITLVISETVVVGTMYYFFRTFKNRKEGT